MTSFDVKRRCLMLKDEIWRHLTSNDVDLLWLKVIFNHFSSKIIDGFFWKIKNVKNRHKSSTQVQFVEKSIRREQRFSSKFVMSDASFDIRKITKFDVFFHQFSSFDVIWRHLTSNLHDVPNTIYAVISFGFVNNLFIHEYSITRQLHLKQKMLDLE